MSLEDSNFMINFGRQNNSHVKAYQLNKLSKGLESMDVFGIGTAISGIANAISNGVISSKNYKEQKRQYDDNMRFQREQFEYQKQLNETMMNREDTAVRRKMTDLKEAGLNPLMADASGGAQSTAGHSTSFSGSDAAQQNYDSSILPVMLSAMLDSRRVKNEIAQTGLERERLANQILDSEQNRLESISRQILNAKSVDEKDALINQYNATIKLINKQARKVGLEADYLEWDMSIDKNRNTKSGENTSPKYNDAKDFLAGHNKDGNGKNPIVETANTVGNGVSPIRKGTIEKMQEQNEKKYKRLKKTRRKRKWFSSAE